MKKIRDSGIKLDDWRRLVDQIIIGSPADAHAFVPIYADTPSKKNMVSGRYTFPHTITELVIRIVDIEGNGWNIKASR